MRRAAKRDDNEPLIVRAIQSAGWTVVRVSDRGVPDLLCAKDGRLEMLEVKSGDGDLTPAQRETFTKLATAGVLVQVVRSPWEALASLGASYVTDPDTGHRWVGVNGAFLCLHCWLPENGLHAKDCPTRKALARPPKVQSAYRAAKTLEEAMPKSNAEAMAESSRAADQQRYEWAKRQSRGVEGELQPVPGMRMAPAFMQDAIKARRGGK